MVGHHLRLLHIDFIHFDIAAHDSFFKAAIEAGVFGNVLTKVPHIISMSNFIFCFTHTFQSFICIRWSDVNCFMPRVFFFESFRSLLNSIFYIVAVQSFSYLCWWKTCYHTCDSLWYRKELSVIAKVIAGSIYDY